MTIKIITNKEAGTSEVTVAIHKLFASFVFTT